MNEKISIVLAQIDLIVGDISGNTTRILEYCERVKVESDADLIIFPELSISGYPPEDLLLHSGLKRRIAEAMELIRQNVRGIAVLVGFPEYTQDHIFNSCAVYNNGKELIRYRKHALPNYSVFDEKRYFTPGNETAVFELQGIKIGINICEDIWYSKPARSSKLAGAELIIVINGSPYQKDGQNIRESTIKRRISEVKIPIVYLNLVGGQDELIFDGASFVMNEKGDVIYRAPAFEETIACIEFERIKKTIVPISNSIEPKLEEIESIYKALVKGTRDYISKHNFPGVVLGLSGGIDSALTLAIACDAIGSDNVRAVMMPFRYTSKMSLEDAQLQSSILNIQYDILPIETLYDAANNLLLPIFDGAKVDATEENIQSRARCILLMAISNKTGLMLLTTGNKSEMAVGYATLYGDMAGGFAPTKD